MDDISGRGKLPVLVGGTGLYYSSLIDNISFADEDDDASIRSELERARRAKALKRSIGNSRLLTLKPPRSFISTIADGL